MDPVPRASSDSPLGMIGVFFGLGCLTYPFGRDQGLYDFVAREWTGEKVDTWLR